MDRRLMGALLVVAVVAVATVVPARDGLRIAGEATVIELPTDPAVGDCLLAQAPTVSASSAPPAGPAQAADGSPTIQAATFGRCAGQPVVGEVAAIVTATGNKRDSILTGGSSGTDCRTDALTYAGLTATDGRYAPPRRVESDVVNWKFSINVRTSWALPSPLLRAAGRTWAACVVRPAGSDMYVGGLASAYNGGRLPNAFGMCWSSREVSVAIQKVDCAEPHLAELIAMGDVAGRDNVTPSEISRSCQTLAAEVMGRADPTANGGLSVLIDPDAGDSFRWTRESMGVVCYVVPNGHSLNGTLVGLHDRPVPYSG